MALTKMGFKNIATWDPDKIEEHNIANQMFPVESVGMRKAIATRDMVKQFSGEDIVSLSVNATAKKVAKFMRDTFPHCNKMVLLCVDSLDVRRELAEGFAREYNIHVIDARMGAKTYRVLGFSTCRPQEFADYMATLVPDKDAVQERCGQKSIIYTVLGVAAEVCSFIHQTIMSAEEGGYYKVPNPVVFDYGTGLRLQRRTLGHIEKLDEMHETPEPVVLDANTLVIDTAIPAEVPY